MNDIYDAAFRTLLNDCPHLIIPLLNEMFGEHFKGDEKIEFFPNEHFINQNEMPDKERITDSNFSIYSENGKKNYHWECQSTKDDKMLIRLFEYDAQIALDNGAAEKETLTVNFPNSAVLYLRSTKNTPKVYEYVIKTPGGTVSYKIPIMKVKSYSLNDIFNKNLLFLIPFYIFNFESKFKIMNEEKTELQKMLNEYKTILKKLNELLENGHLGEFDKRTIIELSDDVSKFIAEKYQNVQQGVEEIMGGGTIETEAKRILNKGIEQGVELGENKKAISDVKNLMKNLSFSLEKALDSLSIFDEEREFVINAISNAPTSE